MKQKTRIIIYIAIAVTILVSGILAVLSSSQEVAEKSKTFIDLGNKYLIELSYDKAVIEFNKAIEIEPKNADAYIGLAEAYIGLGDTDRAVDALERGYDLTGDERIKARLDELKPLQKANETITENTTIITEAETLEIKFTTTVPKTTTVTETTTIFEPVTTMSATTVPEITAATTVVSPKNTTAETSISEITTSETVQNIKIPAQALDYAGMTFNEVAELFKNNYELRQGQYGNYAMYIPENKYMIFPQNAVYNAADFSFDDKLWAIEISNDGAYLSEGLKIGDLFDNWVKKSPDTFSWEKVFVEGVNFSYAYSIYTDKYSIWIESNIIAENVSFDNTTECYVSTDNASDFKDKMKVSYIIIKFC